MCVLTARGTEQKYDGSWCENILDNILLQDHKDGI